MALRLLKGSLATLIACAAVLAVVLSMGVVRAVTFTEGSLTCAVCDNPSFVACNAGTTASPRCAGAKGNELRIFCPGASTPYLTIACQTPKIRYGLDAHGLPDKTQNVISCQ